MLTIGANNRSRATRRQALAEELLGYGNLAALCYQGFTEKWCIAHNLQALAQDFAARPKGQGALQVSSNPIDTLFLLGITKPGE